MNKVQKINTVCEVVNKFVTEHEGLLDEKGVKDLQSMADRVRELASTATRTRDEITSWRSRRDESFDRLQRLLKECRMAIKIVAVRGRKEVVVPPVGKDLWKPTRIKNLAERYLQALENAGDPSTTARIEELKAALAEFTLIVNETTLKVYNTRTAREKMKLEAEDIAGVLDGYISFIVYRLPRSVRAELYNRIRAAVPRHGSKNSGSSDAAATDTGTNNITQTTTDPQPVQIPAQVQQQAAA